MRNLTETLGNSKIWNFLFKPSGFLMGSSLRKWIFNPEKTLQGADVRPGESVLEVGCGTGFFTIPAAKIIGSEGRLVAMDVMSGFLEQASKKVEASNLNNVRIIKRDALDTGLDSGSFDKALLFGVIPFPSLPLSILLPEMRRILKPDGRLAVWLFPVSFGIPKKIVASRLFKQVSRKNGVYNFSPL